MMSFAALRRGERKSFVCSSLKGRNSVFFFFFKTGNRKEGFEEREALPFAVGSLCHPEGTLP